MAKIYDQKNEPGKPGEPEQVQKRGMMLVIGIILALLVIFVVYRMASGEELSLTEVLATTPIVSSFYVTEG